LGGGKKGGRPLSVLSGAPRKKNPKRGCSKCGGILRKKTKLATSGKKVVGGGGTVDLSRKKKASYGKSDQAGALTGLLSIGKG